MNTECLEKNIYQSMTWCPGRTRTPGVRKRVYFLPKHFILGWPEHGSGDNKGKYVGNFTLADGKYFNYMDVVTNDSKITAETQGEYPCKTFRQHGEAFYPGLEEDITDFEEVVRLDTEYIENWNLGLDIKILFKTVMVVLHKDGSR